MSTILALLSLTLLALTSLINDGAIRTFEVSSKRIEAPQAVIFNSEYLKQAKLAEKFIWTFGDGQTFTTTSTSVSHAYLTAGTFTAKLQYLKKSTDAISKAVSGGQVKIVVTPKPNLLPVPKLSCISNEINKLDCDSRGSLDTDGSIVSYKFDWGDSTANEFTNAGATSHQYQSAGEKIVRLTVTDNKGGTAFVEKSFNLKANTAPIASFNCTKNGIQKIYCESASTDNEETLSNLAWTLDDGSTYSTASFDHTFSRPQDVAISVHNVSLKVTDSLGLESSIAKNIEVDLEALREAPRGYFKAYIDGTNVDLRAFIVKTQFNIKRATYQIYDAQNNLLHTLPVSDFYQNHSTKINLENFGNYRVTFTIVDYRDQQIVVTRQVPLVEDTSTLSPFVAFRAVQSNIRTLYLNLNQSFDYDENYSIREFVVNLGNGQTRTLTTDTFLTYTYPVAGTYTLSVTAKTNHGTERTISQPITITNSEVAPIMPDPTFAYRIYSFAQNVSFYNEKSGTPNGEIISYLWDFGDGTTAAGETQAHFYMPGDYLVTLTVVDTAGYSSTQTQKISILAEGDDIVANIDCTQRQPYLDITQMCKVNALDKFNEINRIRVVWGDGAVFTLATPFDPRQGVYYPQKAYTAEGTYAVRLIVNTARGAFKTHDISHTVTARRPVANIQCVVNNLLVNCHALGSFDPKGTQLTYEFNLGNGHSEINNTGLITYAYSAAGLYDVSVKVIDAQGMFSIATTKVQVVRPPNILPIANFNCDSPQPHTLYCSEVGISDQDGFVVSKKLSFDDGDYGFLNPENPTRKQFATGGQHEITLTVIDNDGGVATVTKSFDVKVNNPPIANFECNTYGPQKMNCYSTSTDNDQRDFVATFNWEFGDGATQNGLTGWFDHVYGVNPIYKVKLTVFDQYGGSSTIEKEITMLKNKAPYATIQCLPSNGSTYNCTADAHDDDGYVSIKYWTIEGVKISDWSTVYNFTNGGEYPVTFTMVDDLGKMAIQTITVHVDKLIADFNCIETSPLNISCDASNSTDPSGAELSYYRFEYDNKDVTIGINGIYTFSSFGDHQIKLIVRNQNGDESSKTVKYHFDIIYLQPVASFEIDVGLNKEVKFDASKSLHQNREVVLYEWNFGDGTNFSSSNPFITKTYGSFGPYSTSLTVTDKKGIKNTYSKNIEVYNPEVQDPGENGKSSYLGIDSDNDGIRDDVQLIINNIASSDANLKTALRALVKNYSQELVKVSNRADITNEVLKNDQIQKCLSSFDLGESGVDIILKTVNFAYFNTEERARAYYLIESLSSRVNLPSTNLNEDLTQYCQGL